jgi:hypothetical protein
VPDPFSQNTRKGVGHPAIRKDVLNVGLSRKDRPGFWWQISGERPVRLNLLETVIDPKPKAPSHTYHFIGSCGRTADAQHRSAFFQKPDGDGVEHFTEIFITYLLGSGKLNQG